MKYNHFAVMRYIACRYKPLAVSGKHENFFRTSGLGELEEFIEKQSIAKEHALIALDEDDFVQDINSMGQGFETAVFSFIILRKAKQQNVEDMQAAQAFCKHNATAIMQKMQSFSKKGEQGIQRGSLQNEVTYIKIGYMNGFWALLCQFSVKETLPCLLKNDDWDE